ncbi:hypothetical protein BaRGS_00008194 [Batillaria attramentaria]|uniref:Uncharacterized protein n=1 Tax=Batillaria attramentaria TaxID=370345 RepID=A0ABD0LNM8_9CAEN
MEYQVIMVGSDVDPPRPNTDLPLATELAMADCPEPRRTYDITPSQAEEPTSETIPDAAESQKHPAKYDWTPKFYLLRNHLPRLPPVNLLSFSPHNSMGDVDASVDGEGVTKPNELSDGSSTRVDVGLNTVTSLLSNDARVVTGHPAGGDQLSSTCSISSSAECQTFESRAFDSRAFESRAFESRAFESRALDNNNTVDDAEYPAIERDSVDLRPDHDGRPRMVSGQKQCLCETSSPCGCAQEECAGLGYYRTEDNLGGVDECRCLGEDEFLDPLCMCPEDRSYICPGPGCSCVDYCEVCGDDVDGQCECPDPDCKGPDGHLEPGATCSDGRLVPDSTCPEGHLVPGSTSVDSGVPSLRSSSSNITETGRHSYVASPTREQQVDVPESEPVDVHLPRIHAQGDVQSLCKRASSAQFSWSSGKKEQSNPLATNLPKLVDDVSPVGLLDKDPEITLETLEKKRPRGNSTSVTDVSSGTPLLYSSPVRKSVSDPNSFHCPKRKQEEHLFDCGPLNTNEDEHFCSTTFPVLKTSPCKKRGSKIPKLINRAPVGDTTSKQQFRPGQTHEDTSESYVILSQQKSPRVDQAKRDKTKDQASKQSETQVTQNKLSSTGKTEKARKPAMATLAKQPGQTPQVSPIVNPKRSPIVCSRSQKTVGVPSPQKNETLDSHHQPAPKSPDVTGTSLSGDCELHVNDLRVNDADKKNTCPLTQETTTIETGKMVFKKTGLLAEIMVRKTHSARGFPKVADPVKSPPAVFAGLPPGTSPPRSGPIRKVQSTMLPAGARTGPGGSDKTQTRPPSQDPQAFSSSPPSHGHHSSVRSIMKRVPQQRHEGEKGICKMATLRPDRNFLYPHSKAQADANENTNSIHSPHTSPTVPPNATLQLHDDPQMFSGGLKLPKTIRFNPTPQVQEIELHSFRKAVSRLSGRGPSLVPQELPKLVFNGNATASRIPLPSEPALLPIRVTKSRSLRRSDPYPTAVHKPCSVSLDSEPDSSPPIAAFPLPVHPNRPFLLCRPGKEKED